MTDREMRVILQRAEAQLRPIVDEFETLWDTCQNDDWDCLTNFIYWPSITSYERLKSVVSRNLGWHREYQRIKKYAIARWYNFRVSACLEWVFCQFPGVVPEANKRHKHIDFYMNEIPLDLKVTGLPPNTTLDEARKLSKVELLKRFYRGQSRSHRYGVNNRLIVSVANPNANESDWKSKSKFNDIYLRISKYMSELTGSGNLMFIKDFKAQGDVLLVIA